MICNKCSREVKDDANFCDNCGHFLKSQNIDKKLNIKFLMGGIFLSLLITIIITGFAGAIGFPLIFGGLFLPFFWNFKKKDN